MRISAFVDEIIEKELRTGKQVTNGKYKLLCSRTFFYDLLEELLNTEEMINKVSGSIALQYKNIDIVIDSDKDFLSDYEFVLKTVCDEVGCDEDEDEDEEEWGNYNYDLNEVESCKPCCTRKQYFIDKIRYYMNRYKKLDGKVWLETFKEDTKDFYLFFEGDDGNEGIQVCEYYDI